VAWTGNRCLSITGCECVGRDCSGLPYDFEECEKLHADCIVPF
jgi:hypothetical protein